ncbi:IGR protein motif-domain-containing protein [Xylariales sp. AK1849]|nr:IGR protein motif-domain-containing protein [Xylariales sp. AK1849]
MASFKPIFRPRALRQAFTLLHNQNAVLRPVLTSIRAASTSSQLPEVPEPTPFCPDVPTFLKLIGRGLSVHASKFPTWEALFSLTSDQLRELGIEPPRSRRYLIQWRQRFRRGQFGIGGDLKHVQDGVADLRVLEHDVDPVKLRKYVINVPASKSLKETPAEELSRVQGYHVEGARTITGPYAIPSKSGEGASVAVTEGMWEDKRGRKIDGGERRRTEVRYKKRIQERREMRERGEIQ